jgi:hypothetical protein
VARRCTTINARSQKNGALVQQMWRHCSVFLSSLSKKKRNPIISDSVVDRKWMEKQQRKKGARDKDEKEMIIFE